MSKNLIVDGNTYTGVQKIEALDSNTNEYVQFVDTSDANATTNDIKLGKTAYVDGSKITGSYEGDADEDAGCLFIDYDGAELHKYSVSEALALTTLPSNPVHTGLIAQGWNWTLQEIKSYLTSYPDAMVVVGQTYNTNDSSTKLYLTLTSDSLSPSLHLKHDSNTSVTIDWGDGSSTQTSVYDSTYGGSITKHTYSTSGNYTISFLSSGGNVTIPVASSTSSSAIHYVCGLFTDSVATLNDGSPYNFALRKIFLGDNAEFTTTGSPGGFGWLVNLSEITLPSSCPTALSSYLFYNCVSLKSVVLPRKQISFGLGTFAYSGVSYVSIPSICTGTYGAARWAQSFQSCKNLKYITIPENLSINNRPTGESVWEDCVSLRRVSIPLYSSATGVGSRCFSGCQSLTKFIGRGINSLGQSSFAGCISLINVITSPSAYIRDIPQGCFSNCYSLINVSGLAIDSDNENNAVGEYGLQNCYNLQVSTAYIYPGGVNALSGLRGLKKLFLHHGTSAYPRTCMDCVNLEEVTLQGGTTITESQFQGCTSLKTINMPDTIRSIGHRAFYNCVAIETLTLSPTLKTLDSYAFSGCVSLKDVVLPNTVEAIYSHAFENCYSLHSINIPQNVSFLYYTFRNCVSLGSVYFECTTPPSIDGSTFQNVPSTAIVIVPFASYASYRAATYYPATDSRMIGFATYTSGEVLPTTDQTSAWSAVWYATVENAKTQTNPITVGNGDEVYCRCTATS